MPTETTETTGPPRSAACTRSWAGSTRSNWPWTGSTSAFSPTRSSSGYFEGQDVSRIKRHQVLLLSQVLGGPAEYSGRRLAEAHARLAITGPDYDRVVEHLVGTLRSLAVDDCVVSAVEGVVGGVKPDVVTTYA